MGLVLLAAGAVFAYFYDQQLDRRAESNENVRFVRQAVMEEATMQPFRQLYLRGAPLVGLDLGCRNPGAARAAAFTQDRIDAGCADLSGADLSSASLQRTVLRYALLTDVDLRDANLSLADLGGAVLYGAKLQGAQLDMTDLREADLRGADLKGVDLSSACYDDSTFWPDDFTPDATDTPTCVSGGERIEILDDGGP